MDVIYRSLRNDQEMSGENHKDKLSVTERLTHGFGRESQRDDPTRQNRIPFVRKPDLINNGSDRYSFNSANRKYTLNCTNEFIFLKHLSITLDIPGEFMERGPFYPESDLAGG